MKRAMLAAAAVTILGLTACSEKARNETADAADAVAADAESTTRDAVNDVDAAFDSAQNKMDAIGDQADNSTDDNAAMEDDAE